MEWLRPLTRWSTDGTAARLAAASSKRAGTAVLDWFGAYYAGAASSAAEPYRNAAALLGNGKDSDLTDTAWLVAALSHIEEIDDGHRLAMLHPGVVVIPPVLGLAARHAVSFAQMRTAITAGYEVAVRIGAALGPEHYKRHHTTATAGVFGAAAAAGVLLDLDEERALWALGHAGTQAAGLWQLLDDGAEAAKPAHIGHAVRNGLWAASLAKSGVPGATRILEGDRGLAKAFGLSLDRSKLKPADTVENLALTTATTKAWPVCGQMHHILDAVQELRARTGVPADEITEISVESFSATLEIAGISNPQTIAQARFSTPVCVAILWTTGQLSLSSENVFDPAIRALAAKVRLKEDPHLTRGFPAIRAGRVTVSTRSGERITEARTGRRGDPEFPLSEAEMSERFDTLAAAQPAARREAVRVFSRQVAQEDGDEMALPETVADLIFPVLHKVETSS